MIQPYGLGLIALAIAIPFLFWRLVLGKAFTAIGFRPLLVGYVAATVGLAVQSFSSSYLEFSTRVTSGILSDTDRWSIVPGWAIYAAVLSLLVVLPILGVIAVPLSAKLLKHKWLNYRSIFVTTLAVWVAFALIVWLFPSNEWHHIHRLESFATLLKELAPGVLLVGLPFLFAILWSSPRGHRAEP